MSETDRTPIEYELLVAADIAKLLHCSPRHVCWLAEKGRIPALRVTGGRRWLFYRHEVEEAGR